MADPASRQQTGPGVDVSGSPVPDPTANVLALVDAAVKRLDDLREAETSKREAISHHLRELIELRALHAQQLREAEAKRIDAIRSVDVNAVSVDRERAAAAANVLATQVATSAEALRSLVDSTARAQAAQSANQFTQLSDRITSLEKSAYEGVGKGQVMDPQLVQLLAEMKQVRGTSSAGMASMFGWIVGGIGVLVAIISVVVAVNGGS